MGIAAERSEFREENHGRFELNPHTLLSLSLFNEFKSILFYFILFLSHQKGKLSHKI